MWRSSVSDCGEIFQAEGSVGEDAIFLGFSI